MSRRIGGMANKYQTSLIFHTSTILAHWVPFPAPGPPNTNTTIGFTEAINDLARHK